MEVIQNRRRFPRIPSRYSMLVTSVGGEVQEEIASTRSLSLGGCGFRSTASLGEGAALELLISLKLRPLSVPGRVVWESPRRDGAFDVGVEFTSLGHDERLILEQHFNTV